MVQLTKGQMLMIEDGLPSALIMNQTERRERWSEWASLPAQPQPKRIEDMAKAKNPLRKPQKAAKAASVAPRLLTKTQTKKVATASPRAKERASKADAPAPRAGSKLHVIVELLKRPGGCTTKDVLAATGWPAVSMPQQARAAGLSLVKEKKDGATVYSAA